MRRAMMRAISASELMGRTVTAVLTLFLLLYMGCDKQRAGDARTGSKQGDRLAASEKSNASDSGFDYLKVRREFDRADFFKPATGSADEDTIRMAPLIVREVVENGEHAWQWGVDVATLAQVDLPTTTPTHQRVVYFHRDEVAIGGWAHQRLTYIWVLRQRDGDQTHWCGIQLVRGLDGRPVLSEVIGSAITRREIYAAQTVEDRAWIEFGKPFSNRRYAVEAALSDAPNTFVARVIADGPEPMGPFVYLESNGREVNTLLCRCMTSQYHSVRKNAYYQLHPLAATDLDYWPAGLESVAALLDGSAPSPSLESVLRVPDLHAEP